MSTSWSQSRVAAGRLTREELAAFRRAWAEFTDPAWQPFRKACMERGFLPPQGTDEDDPDTSLRSKLWRIADDRPNDLGRWVAESAGADLYAVVADVFNHYGAIRTDAGVDDQEWIQAKAEERAAAKRSMARVGELIDGVGTEPGAPGVGELLAENEVLRTGKAGAGQLRADVLYRGGRVEVPI